MNRWSIRVKRAMAMPEGKVVPFHSPMQGWLKRASSLVLCVLLVVSGSVRAVDANRLLTQYAHTAWRLQDGELPAPAFPVTQTADGYLWIGTQAGVVRYDGARFVPLDELTNSRLRNPFVISLLGAKDGSLWIGTLAGVSRWKDGVLTEYGHLKDSTSAIAEDDGGKIWLLTRSKESKPLCEITGSGVTCHGKPDGLDPPKACCDRMVTDGKGSFWMGGDASLVAWSERGRSTSFPMDAMIKSGTPSALFLEREPTGEVWVGVSVTGAGLGLQRLVGHQWEPFEVPGLAGNSLAVQALHRDRAGALWIGTIDHGIYRLASGRVDHLDADDGLTSNCIYSFFEDKEGNMWVTTSAGVDRFRDFKVWSYTTREGLGVDEVDSVLAGHDGKIWIGTAAGLDVLDHGRLQTLHAHKELPGTQVTALFEDRAGRLWVGLDEGLWTYADGKFTAVLDQHGNALKGMVVGLAQDAREGVWAIVRGQPSMVARISDGKVVEELATPWSSLARQIASDGAGGIWLGLNNGDLARPDGGGQRISTHLDATTRDVVVARDGLVLGATDKGLVVAKDGALRILSSKDGLPCDGVNALVTGEDDALWLYMGCGLAKLQLSDVDHALRNPGQRVAASLLDVLDGARPGRAPFQAKASRAPDGSLWFANGVILQTLDPHASKVRPGPLPVYIESLTADRKLYPLIGTLALPALTRDVQFDYTALGLAVPQHIRFRYRLEGRDQDWVDAGQRRQAFYTDLLPGTYRFRVAAAMGDTGWVEASSPVTFSVMPAFYQTRLFLFLVVALIAITLWMLFAWRLSHVRRQMRTIYEERHAERERIARELHDTFLQAVQGLMLRFQSAMERIPPTQPARDLMEKALDHADEVIVEGRDRVTQLRTQESSGSSLDRALRQIGEDLARDTHVTFSLTVEGLPRSVDPAVAEEIRRLAQEAMANAFRHARASHIDVSLAYERKRLAFSVVDDGVGFDVATVAHGQAAGHWGLKGMHERAAGLHARLTLSSRPGAGTALELEVPAAIAFRLPASPWRRWLATMRMMFGSRRVGARSREYDEV